MRTRAPLTLRSRLDSRSRLRIASSRSPASCTSSKASGVFSMAISSRLRRPTDNSACLASRIALYLFFLVLFIFVLPVFFYLLYFLSLAIFPTQQYRRKFMPKVSHHPIPHSGHWRTVLSPKRRRTCLTL